MTYFAEKVRYQIGDQKVGFVDLPRTTPMDKICEPDTDILIFILSRPENKFFRRQLRRVWANKCNLAPHHIKIVTLIGMTTESAKLTTDLRSVGKNGQRAAPTPNSTIPHPSKKKFRVTHQGFVVKSSVVTESLRYGDLVMVDYPESYQNLTYKVAAGFLWAKVYCPQAVFVGKVDDDVFLGVERLVRYLQGHYGPKRVIGSHNMVHPPSRVKTSRCGFKSMRWSL